MSNWRISSPFFAIIFITYLIGCGALKPREAIRGLPPSESQLRAQQATLLSIESMIEREDYSSALLAIHKFQQKYPNSVYYLQSVLDQAQANQGLGLWEDSVKNLNVVLANSKEQPRFKALALIALAHAYEAAGDSVRARASLLDAYALRSYLPKEKALAELPAYLAVSFNQAGLRQEAKRYLEIAENGINQLKQQANQNQDLFAELFFRMGKSGPRESGLGFTERLRGFELQQIHLLRSAEEASAKWSSLAAKQLIESYDHYWQEIANLKASINAEPAVAQRERTLEQLRLSEELLLAMNKLFLYEQPSNVKANSYVQEIETHLDGLKRKIESFLAQNNVVTPLTNQSDGRSSLKREGKIQSAPIFPNERN